MDIAQVIDLKLLNKTGKQKKGFMLIPNQALLFLKILVAKDDYPE